jgi:hypothetical protein
MPEASLKEDFNLSLKTIEDSGITIGNEQKGLKAFHYLYCRIKKPFPAAMIITHINPGYSMVTTNLAFEEWTEIFGSERLTGALLDRLTHRCHILEANGESYRFRQARKRSNSKPSTRQD